MNKMALSRSLIGGLAIIFSTSPAVAGEVEENFAICVWEKEPKSAELLLKGGQKNKVDNALMKAYMACGNGADITLDLAALGDAFEKTKPQSND